MKENNAGFMCKPCIMYEPCCFYMKHIPLMLLASLWIQRSCSALHKIPDCAVVGLGMNPRIAGILQTLVFPFILSTYSEDNRLSSFHQLKITFRSLVVMPFIYVT